MLAISSTGRQDHRIRFPGEDVSGFSVLGYRGQEFYYDGNRPSFSFPLGSTEGGQALEVGRLSTMPWGDAQVLVISTERGGPRGPRGRFVEAAGGSWTCEAEGLEARVETFAYLRLPGNQNEGLVEKLTSLIDDSGRVRATLSSSRRGNGIWSPHLAPPFTWNRLAAPRGFLIWAAVSPRAAVESPDLAFEEVRGRNGYFLAEIDTVPLAGPPDSNPKER